jgi:hypothetical protein
MNCMDEVFGKDNVNRARAFGRSRSATASWWRGIKISASFHHDSRRDSLSSDMTRDTTRKISFKPTSRALDRTARVPRVSAQAAWFSAPTTRSRSWTGRWSGPTGPPRAAVPL